MCVDLSQQCVLLLLFFSPLLSRLSLMVCCIVLREYHLHGVLCVCVSEDRSQNSYLYKLESLCHSFLCQSLVEADDRRRRVRRSWGWAFAWRDGRLAAKDQNGTPENMVMVFAFKIILVLVVEPLGAWPALSFSWPPSLAGPLFYGFVRPHDEWMNDYVCVVCARACWVAHLHSQGMRERNFRFSRCRRWVGGGGCRRRCDWRHLRPSLLLLRPWLLGREWWSTWKGAGLFFFILFVMCSARVSFARWSICVGQLGAYRVSRLSMQTGELVLSNKWVSE